MKQCWLAIILVGILSGMATSCTRKVSRGNPNVPLSKSNGVTCTFDVPDSTVATAITNAFSGNQYRGMLLEDARDYPGWHLTRGLVLSPFLGVSWDKNPFSSVGGAITNIPLDNGKVVPYRAFFYIDVIPVASNRTMVTIRTILAQVIDGQETGLHGGWADHFRNVSPIRQEDENILDRIAQELKAENYNLGRK